MEPRRPAVVTAIISMSFGCAELCVRRVVAAPARVAHPHERLRERGQACHLDLRDHPVRPGSASFLLPEQCKISGGKASEDCKKRASVTFSCIKRPILFAPVFPRCVLPSCCLARSGQSVPMLQWVVPCCNTTDTRQSSPLHSGLFPVRVYLPQLVETQRPGRSSRHRSAWLRPLSHEWAPGTTA